MANKKGEIVLDFSDVSGGMNTTDPPNSLKPNQAQLIRNCFALSKGFKKIQGFVGLSGAATAAATSKMLDCYYRTDGTDLLLLLTGGKLYTVNKSTNAITERYNLTGTGEGYGDSFQDKYFIANGTACAKLEGTTGYKLGIAAPTGATVAAVAGGSLAAGVYTVYCSYARGNNLYSVAQSLGNVTMDVTNQTIRVTLANSADSQVTNKVIWVKEPGSTVIYFYHQTNDNTTTTINITSNAALDTTKLYRILGEQSVVPPALSGIVAHNNSLYGWLNNTLYKSLYGTTIYDLERWPDITYTFPFLIDGIFTIGKHLYLNSNRGIYVLPYGDMTAEYTRLTKRLYFKYFRTVRLTDDKNMAIGVTNDGVRIFDGEKFSIDISKHIKPEIDKLYSGAAATAFKPCAAIYNRSFRTEYRLSYLDSSLASVCNNRQLVLNLDTLYINDNNDYNAAWEIWEHGFSYSATDVDGVLYMLQMTATASQIIKESASVTTDQNHIDYSGTLKTTATAKTKEVTSRVINPDISYLLDWIGLWIYSKQAQASKIWVYVSEDFDNYNSLSVSASGSKTSLFGTAKFGQDVFSTTKALIQRLKPKMNLTGKAYHIRYEQTADDNLLQVYEIKALTVAETGVFT